MAKIYRPGVMILALFSIGWPGGAVRAQEISPRRLVEISDFGSPVVSPDGTRVAFRIEQASVDRNTYNTTWYVQRIDGDSPPLKIADGGLPLRDSAGLPIPTHLVWSQDGHWVFFRAFLDGKIDVWRAASDGSSSQPLTLDPADVRDFSLADDSRLLRYSVGATRIEIAEAERAEYDDGIHIDKDSPIGQPLFRSGFIEGRLATQRLGTWFNRVPLLANIPDHWKSIDLKTGERRSLAPGEASDTTTPAYDAKAGGVEVLKRAFDQHSTHVALITQIDNGGRRQSAPKRELFVQLDASTRQRIKCLAELCKNMEITDILWRPGFEEIIFTVTDYGDGYAQSIFRWNFVTGAVRKITEDSGLISGEGRWTPGSCGASSIYLVCIAAEAGRPPRLERINIETGQRKVLFEPNAALDYDMARNVSVRLLQWTDQKGRRFSGQFFPAQTTNSEPPPLFVTYYDCKGYLRGGSGDEWPLATFAQHGIAALCINAFHYRLNAVQRYGAALSAVESAIKLLTRKHEIDGAKVGMGGLSFGAESTYWTLMYSKLLTAASVSSETISSEYYISGKNKGKSFLDGIKKYWQLGPPNQTPIQWKRLSPGLNLDKIKSPLLIQVPEQEFFYCLDYAVPLMKQHKADVFVFPNEPHIKFQPRHKLAIYERNLDWFRFWLQGYEDPDPAKSEQYQIWRSMRQPGKVGRKESL